ncbi:MAG: hypothetical protein RDV00_10675 [Clostridia bacterium]|nr:hypothetical protein [Clostridia bacterium]MDQ7792566.1 hypothetical protein [Clostridia bacterium]
MGKDSLDLNSLLGLVQGFVNQPYSGSSEGTQLIPDETQIQEFLSGAFGIAKEHLDPEQQEAVAKLLESLLQQPQK